MPDERAIAIVLTSRSLKLVEFDLKEAIASLKAGQQVILVSLDTILKKSVRLYFSFLRVQRLDTYPIELQEFSQEGVIAFINACIENGG